MRCCALAGIQTRAVDLDGREIDHVDVHSRRRWRGCRLLVRSWSLSYSG
jgi:hypothetical protein